MTSVTVHADCGDATLVSQARDVLDRSLVALGVGSDLEMALVLTDDETLRSLNLRFRGIDAPTDVLSFRPARLPAPSDAPTDLGDIVLSVPCATRNAVASGHGLHEEVCLLVVHGLLHLLGHEDESDEGAAAMRALERDLGVRPDA